VCESSGFFVFVRTTIWNWFSFVRFRLRSESEANEDGHSLKKFVFSVGRNDLFVQLPVRTVVSFPRVPEVSFVSWGIRSSRSCKPDSEFRGRSAIPTHYNLAWNSSVRSIRSLRFREFPNASVRLRIKYEAGRTNSFCLMASSYRSYAFVQSFVRVFVWGLRLRWFVRGFRLGQLVRLRYSVWGIRSEGFGPKHTKKPIVYRRMMCPARST